MPRPRKAIRPVEKNISLPEDLVARVNLELYSDLEGKVPFGAWQRYVEGLIRADLERRAALEKVERLSETPGATL